MVGEILNNMFCELDELHFQNVYSVSRFAYIREIIAIHFVDSVYLWKCQSIMSAGIKVVRTQ